jgi:hypothetical protein
MAQNEYESEKRKVSKLQKENTRLAEEKATLEDKIK